MPQAIAYIAAVVADFVAAYLGDAAFAAAYYAVEVTAYVALAVATNLAFAPSIPKPGSVQTPLKQSFGPRRSAFGEVRVSGTYALFEAVNNYSLDVLALLDGRSDSVTRYYLNDDRPTVDPATGAAYVPGSPKFGGGPPGHKVFVFSRLGLPTETAYAAITAHDATWDAAHRGDGVTSMAVVSEQSKSKDQQTDFPNGAPLPGLACRAQLIFDPRDPGQVQGDKSTYVWNDNSVLGLLAYLTDANGGMGLDYASHIAPTVAGWIAAADDCDMAEATDGQHGLVEAGGVHGTATVTLSNVTGLAGGVAISVPTEIAVVAGVAGSIVTLTSNLLFDQAAGVVATWAATGVEKRYRCAGVYDHDNAPADVNALILASFDGWMAPRYDGALVVKSGRYYEPTVTFADKHVISYSLTHFLPDEQAVNQYVVSYTDPNSEFTTVEVPEPVRDDVDIAARGRVRSSPLELPWVPSASQAVRLGKRKLTRSTQELRGTVTTNLYGMKGLGERYIRLQIADNAALNDLVVEITDKVQIDLANLTLTFPWVAATPTIDDGDPGTGFTPPGVPPPRPTPGLLVPPTITALTAVYDDAGAGVAGARISIDISAPVTSNVQWLARWKLSAATDWHEYPYSDIADGAAVTLLTGFVAAVGSVDVQVAYITAAQTSPWSATDTIVLATPSILSKDLTASQDLAAGDLVNLHTVAGAVRMRKADATDTSKPAHGFVKAAVLTAATGAFHGPGQVNDAVSGLTPGATYWLGTAAGGVVAAAPATALNGDQEVGQALSATELLFNPKTMVEAP